MKTQTVYMVPKNLSGKSKTLGDYRDECAHEYSEGWGGW